MKGEFTTSEIMKSRKNGCPMIIFIYSPKCSHCKTYESEWDSHYNTFPDYSRNHNNINTPSIGSISFQELNKVPIPVRLGETNRHLHDVIDFVPTILSLDNEGVIDPISNIHDFDNMKNILLDMKSISGGYLHNTKSREEKSDSVKPYIMKSKSTRSIRKKLKKRKRKSKKRKKKKKKKKKMTRTVSSKRLYS